MAKVTRKQFKEQIAEARRQLELAIEVGVSSFDINPAASAQRRARCETDLLEFGKTYFPHYIKHDYSAAHRGLAEDFQQVVKHGGKAADAAPRGEGKSTLISLIGVIWCIVFEKKHYIIHVMDSYSQAALNLAGIKVELESNPRLKLDFPDSFGAGPRWRDSMVVTANNILVQAVGAGMKLRGRRHGPHRPDLVIPDDIENDEQVQTKEQRDKLHRWVMKVLLKLGEQGQKLSFFMLGTILHYDAVITRLQRNSSFKAKKYKSITRWPDNMALWDQWEEIYLNDGEEAGDAFYKKHKGKLDYGCVISWPSCNTILDLMKERSEDHGAFASERQNEPLDDDSLTFKRILFWSASDPRWLYFGACDPSLGKHVKKGDPSAILVGGYNPYIPRLDVIEADIQRRKPSLIVSRIIEFQKEYGCYIWGVESVGFQELLRQLIMDEAAREGVVVNALPTEGGNKELRIASLEPHVDKGRIRLHSRQSTLRDQLIFWPNIDHDDGPDGLEMLYNIAVKYGAFAATNGDVITTTKLGDTMPMAGY